MSMRWTRASVPRRDPGNLTEKTGWNKIYHSFVHELRTRFASHDIESISAIKRIMPTPFDERVREAQGELLTPIAVDTIQANITLKCNLECVHCHVSSSPRRTEMMDEETMDHLHRVTNELQPDSVDLTGGAPEIHPRFKSLVRRLRDNGHDVMVRTNLTILLEDGYEDMAPFLRDQKVNLVASLPCYSEENVDEQRGEGVYNESIEAIQLLNDLGYADDPDLSLDLVYNPVGAHLPPPQQELEQEYKDELLERFGIVFDDLYTITNMPIGMFRHQLDQSGDLEAYRQTLRDNFNPDTLSGLMCRNQVNVAWDGTLYDCDFNLAQRMPVEDDAPQNIKTFDYDDFMSRRIRTGDHCFGCTAGAGSSCGGTIVEDASQPEQTNTASTESEQVASPTG